MSLASWLAVCPVARLTPDRGVAAMVGEEQVAIFLLATGELYGVANLDPFSGAQVMSRGLVGDVDGVPTVASPVYKQRFDLRTGQCLEDNGVCLRTWPVRIDNGVVHVGADPSPHAPPP